MKSILVGPKEKKVSVREYPYLGISGNGITVLFTAPHIGTAVHDPNGHYSAGVHQTNWNERNFELLKGKITLHN